METIDEARLETDLDYRCEYVSGFMRFDADAIAALRAVGPKLADEVPAIADAMYQRLSEFECTWRHFVPRQSGYQGEVPASFEDLTLEHPQIAFRKQHLGR